MPTKNKSISSTPSTSAARSAPTFTHEEISACARAIWEEKGCPQGQDDAIWFEAERRLQDGRGGNSHAKEKDDPAFANPAVPFNLDNEPTGRVERRLRQGSTPPRDRSATSM